MLKGNFIIGKPIIERETREPLGKNIEDAIFVRAERGRLRRDCDCIVGFWVRGTEAEDEMSLLPLGAIAAIGKEEIAVDAGGWLDLAEGNPLLSKQSCKNPALERRILTLDGQDLGTATDVYFDPRTGAIEGYETQGGAFADPKTGKSFVPATRIVAIGDRAVRVPAETAERMKERKSRKNALAVPFIPSASAALRRKAFVVGQVARERVDTPNGSVLLVSGQLITSAHAAVAQNLGILEQLYRAAGGDEDETIASEDFTCTMSSPLGRAWGRRVRQMVENPDGSIVAALGQIVTDREIARAIEHRQEQTLLQAVGCTLDEGDFQAFCERCYQLNTCRIVSWFEGVANRSRSDSNLFWEIPVPMAHDELSESEQIQNALGRPVMKEIRGLDDCVILEVGDLITYHAVKQAMRAEMLAQLLNSVYEE